MRNRKIWIASVLFLFLLCLLVSVPAIERLTTSFPEILLGQVYLTREALPLSPPAYQSAEFVLDEVDVTEVEQAFYVGIQDDVLFWEPTYTGFPRIELSADEIRLLQEWLASGALFYQTPDGSAYQCMGRDPSGAPIFETCTQGEQYMDQFVNARWDAEQNHSVGVLQFNLSGQRLAEIRVYRSNSAVAYVPFEKAGDWWLQGITVW